MKALTAAEMREVDRLTTERYGIPGLQLMETAGTRVVEAFRRIVVSSGVEARNVRVLCGKGNNGGDGFVAARLLASSTAPVRVYLFGKPDELRGDAATNYRRWCEGGHETTLVGDETSWNFVWPEIEAADVIIDAMFGTGFRGTATGPVGRAIEDLNRLSLNTTAPRPFLILALDSPSGLPSDGEPAQGPVVAAHHTVTFTAPKVGQLISPDAGTAGYLEVAQIGSPRALIDEVGRGSLHWLEPQEFSSLPLVRPVDSHKGLYGHVLVVAGSVGKSGAAVMSSHAALRAGAGLVTVATPAPVLPIVASAFPEFMTEPLAATDVGTASRQSLEQGRFARIEEGKTVLAVGPGLGLHPNTQDFIRSIVRQTPLPVILDADGLNAFADHPDELRERKTGFLAITPHPGEMARLLGTSTKAIQGDRVKIAREAAQRWNVHVVLKGSHTIVVAPDGPVFVNTGGNPGLAKGGSGDVLTGVLAALTAQFKTADWVRILALGVYLHASAADLATAGADVSGLLAGEVADGVPKARLKLLQELQRCE